MLKTVMLTRFSALQMWRLLLSMIIVAWSLPWSLWDAFPFDEVVLVSPRLDLLMTADSAAAGLSLQKLSASKQIEWSNMFSVLFSCLFIDGFCCFPFPLILLHTLLCRTNQSFVINRCHKLWPTAAGSVFQLSRVINVEVCNQGHAQPT